MSRLAPLPPNAAGYREARLRGLLPIIDGRQPPRRLDGVPAGILMTRWMSTTVVLFFATIVAGLLVVRNVSVSGVAALALGAVGLLVLVYIWLGLGRVGDRAVEELQAGYTTLVLDEGTFWVMSTRPWRNGAVRVLWDYAGTWVLDRRTGEVVSPPSLDVIAPGVYPSPHDDRRWELWTGRMWAGNFVAPPG